MLSWVRWESSVSVVSPPASAMASSSRIARSTDWMLWRPEPSGCATRPKARLGSTLIARVLRTVLSSTSSPADFFKSGKQIAAPDGSQALYEMANVDFVL